MAKSDNVVPDPEREGKYAFICPGVEKQPPCDFVSAAWPSKASALERGDQHFEEHYSGVPMPELGESGITGAVS